MTPRVDYAHGVKSSAFLSKSPTMPKELEGITQLVVEVELCYSYAALVGVSPAGFSLRRKHGHCFQQRGQDQHGHCTEDESDQIVVKSTLRPELESVLNRTSPPPPSLRAYSGSEAVTACAVSLGVRVVRGPFPPPRGSASASSAVEGSAGRGV